MKLIRNALFFVSCLFFASEGFSFFLTGSGSYGVRSQFLLNPRIKPSANDFLFDQSFRMLAELKANDRSSFFAELRLFESDREARLGGLEDAEGSKKSLFYPVYKNFKPKVSKLYMSYVTDYAVFELGRRPRSWGMGLLYDAGEKPFDPSYSVFDGATAYLNPSQSESLGFMAGL